MFDAHRHDFIPERPHPAAKKIMSLRQNDLIAIEKDGVFREIVRVVKFGANGQITIAAHQEAGPLKERDAKPTALDPFKYSSPTAAGLQKMRARQVRIDEFGRIFDSGPRSPVIIPDLPACAPERLAMDRIVEIATNHLHLYAY